jgi:ribosomal protein L7/L12
MPRCAAMFAGLGRRVRSLLAPLLMLALLPWAGAATPLFLSKATDLVPGNLAGSFSATLHDLGGGAQLQLVNGSNDSARITRLFIQDLDHVLQLGGSGGAPAFTLSGDFTEGLRYDLRLENAGPNKLAVVKVVKDMTGLGLKEAKDLVDAAPAWIAHSLGQEQADASRQVLADAGASVLALLLDGSVLLQVNLPLAEAITAYDVLLTDAGASKLAVVKVVKDLTGLGLKEAKDLVDSAPAVVLRSPDQASADAVKQLLVDAGASVVLNGIGGLVSRPFTLPGGGRQIDAGLELVFDYRGNSSNPDLLLTLPLAGSFQELLGTGAAPRFRMGLEISSATGSDLYLLSSMPTPMPEPQAWLMLMAGLSLVLAARPAAARLRRAAA